MSIDPRRLREVSAHNAVAEACGEAGLTRSWARRYAIMALANNALDDPGTFTRSTRGLVVTIHTRSILATAGLLDETTETDQPTSATAPELSAGDSTDPMRHG